MSKKTKIELPEGFIVTVKDGHIKVEQQSESAGETKMLYYSREDSTFTAADDSGEHTPPPPVNHKL